MEGKKKRGSNYTAVEREVLLELVKKNIHILENKETNASMIAKKRETWEAVCQQYNAIAVSGHRTWSQLRHLYENLKQRSKKNIARDRRLQFYEKSIGKKASLLLKLVDNMEDNVKKQQNETETSFHLLKKNNNEDQHTVTNIFGDMLEVVVDEPESTLDNINAENEDSSSETTSNQTSDILEVVVDEPSTLIRRNAEKDRSTSHANNNQTKKLAHNEKNNVKQQYFMTKLRNAKLETKYLLNKQKMEINKYKIEMQILKLRLNKLKATKM